MLTNMSTIHRFKDRVQAGCILAGALGRYARQKDVVVLALPRGGVPVAFEIARELHLPLDVLVVRKLGVPGWEELAMGAIASGGVRVINRSVVQAEAVTEAMIEQVAARERKELERRELGYRGHAGAPRMAGQTVILVDDGVATGATMESAIKALRQQQVAHVCLAVPVASREAHAQLKPLVEDWVSLMMPEGFRAVGEWYDEFPQVTDAEVTELLVRARGFVEERKGGGLGGGLNEELPR